MSDKKYMKKNDTAPPIKVTLSKVDNAVEPPVLVPMSLTGATVRFIMRRSDTVEAKVDAVMDITDEAGEVEYNWQAGDTDTIGTYLCEIEVVDTASDRWTFWDMRTLYEVIKNIPPKPMVIEIVDELG